MIITKYMKKNNGKYDVFLEDGRVLSLYEEVILEYNLLLNKIISLDSILEIEKHNQKWEVYYYALKQLNRKAFSNEDLKIYLLRKEYPLSLVEDIINKLVEQGYLNDLVFARSYIHQQMITSLKGPLKIKQELYNKKISSDIIEREIDVFSLEEQKNKIKKIVQKKINENRSRGGFALKQKIVQDLKMLGYDYYVFAPLIDDYSFSNNQEIAKKEYDKLYRKYSRKYDGMNLNRIIKEKLYLKGLVYNEKEEW